MEISRIADPVTKLSGDPDIRFVRRLAIEAGPTGEGDPNARSVGVVVDVETEGMDASTDAIIEIALRRFLYDGAGNITRIDRCYSWRQDPGRSLRKEIVRLTRITDDDLKGQFIDEVSATTILNSASVVIAHNAKFDRAFVERRLPDAAGRPWACSCNEIDWLERGFDGRVLGYLLMQAGWFHDGHRADADVDATIAILRHRDGQGRTALAELLDTAGRPTWRVRARGAHFDVKDHLRVRGYRWDPAGKVWWREVADAERADEEFWLAANIYKLEARPSHTGPGVDRIDWHSRHAAV